MMQKMIQKKMIQKMIVAIKNWVMDYTETRSSFYLTDPVALETE
jgi:hypothetical protein